MSIILRIEPKRIQIDLDSFSSNSAMISLIPYNTIDIMLIKRPIHKFEGKMDILVKNNTLYHAQYKSTLFTQSNKVNSYFEDLFLNFKCEIEKKIGKTDQILLRISTNPWTLQAHFDCMNNYLFMLYGSKTIYTFKFDSTITISQERNFLQKTIKMNGDEITKLLLDEHGIRTEKTTIRPGDIFHIPIGTYHIVENKNITVCSIVLNLYNYDTSDDNVNKRFNSLWGNIRAED
jgi:hypothetical protein